MLTDHRTPSHFLVVLPAHCLPIALLRIAPTHEREIPRRLTVSDPTSSVPNFNCSVIPVVRVFVMRLQVTEVHTIQAQSVEIGTSLRLNRFNPDSVVGIAVIGALDVGLLEELSKIVHPDNEFVDGGVPRVFVEGHDMALAKCRLICKESRFLAFALGVWREQLADRHV